MRSFGTIILPLALVLVAGCTRKPPTVLGGNTALQMQSSIQTLRANLAPDRQAEFDQAIATIIYSAKDRRAYQSRDRLTPETIQTLRGLNVGQVIETAKLLRTVSAG